MASESAKAARADFHVALAAVLLPVLSVPLTVGLALRHRRHLRGADRAARLWARRLWLVVLADLVWPLLLLASFASGAAGRVLAERPGTNPKARIGIVPADVQRGPVEVRGVVAGRPAERAGVKIGDLIEKVGPDGVDGMSSLLVLLGTAEADRPVELSLRRAGQPVVVQVVPERPAPGRPRYRLFEPLPGGGEVRPKRLQLLVPALAVPLFALWLWGRRCKAPGTTLCAAVVAAGLAASLLGDQLTAGVLRRVLGPPSVGSFLLTLTAGTSALLIVAALGRALLVRRGLLPSPGEPRPAGGAAIRAILYSYALSARVSLVLISALWLFGRDAEPALTTLPRELAAVLDPDGVLLFALPVVVIGPVAEEVLFRGVLLPWLRGFSSESVALWCSAAFFALAHLHYGAHLLSILPIGLALGWARLRSGGLAAPILAHTAINGLGVLALAVRVGG